MFKLPVNALFTLRSLSSLISDKEFREALLMDLLLDRYANFISSINFLIFKLLDLVFSNERVFSFKDAS